MKLLNGCSNLYSSKYSKSRYAKVWFSFRMRKLMTLACHQVLHQESSLLTLLHDDTESGMPIYGHRKLKNAKSRVTWKRFHLKINFGHSGSASLWNSFYCFFFLFQQDHCLVCPFFPGERSIDGQRHVPNTEQASVIMLLAVIIVIAGMM